MAAPTVESTQETAVSSNVTTHTLTFPTPITAGATLIDAISLGDDNNNTVWPSTGTVFNKLFETTNVAGADDMTLSGAWAEADGTEDGGTFDVTVDGGEKSFSVCKSLTGAADPDTSPPEVGTAATGQSDSPNPPSLTPTGGPKDFFYFACSSAVLDTFTGFPTGYGNTGSGGSGSAGGDAALGYADKGTTGSSSDDPAVFTLTSVNWIAQTFGVHPAAADGDVLMAQVMM